jgi:hypothetical protein
VSEQNEIVSQVEIGGANSKMKTTNKNEGYPEINHASNVSRSFSNENNKPCGICRNGEHKVHNCEKFKRSDVKTRWRLAELHRLCFSCGMCGSTKFHHPMLQESNIVMDTVNVIDENISQVILRIVPVKIRWKLTIDTYA